MSATIVSRLQVPDPDADVESRDIELVLRTAEDLCYENAHHLLDAVTEMLSHNPQAIVVELSDQGMIDSSGIRALLQSRRMCVDSGTKFAIASLSSCAARTIRMSGFDKVFEIDSGACRTSVPLVIPETSTIPGSSSFELVAVSEAAVVPTLRDRIAQAAVRAGADPDTLCDIEIAVGEALTNAYKHGSPQKGVDTITVRCTTTSGSIIIEIEDHGGIFDPDATPVPDPDKMIPHGMGLYLMKQTMDSVQIFSRECGTIVRMLKKWPAVTDPDAKDCCHAV